MSGEAQRRRVVIALTESSTVPKLWSAAIAQAAKAPVEIVAVFVSDDRWRRAASLAFTREVSRAAGASADFTRERAEEIDRESVAEARRQIERLSAESQLEAAFEILSEFDRARIEELLGVGPQLLIAPAMIRSRPIYAELTRLNCRLLLVDGDED